MTLLWHGNEPIGICVFVSPPVSLSQRNRYFGRRGRWDSTVLKSLNRQLVLLQRVVLHPTYRGAGVAVPFVERSCELCPYPWIETLTRMGHIHPFFEKAGFTRVGVSRTPKGSRTAHSRLYGRQLSEESHRKSAGSEPVYYVRDNRGFGHRASGFGKKVSHGSCSCDTDD